MAAALLLGAATPVAGQLIPYGFGGETPSQALGRHLRTVVASPRNLDALRGAGLAALELGDLDAAVGFLARAEEVSPRDGRTKAGLGSAFTMLQQPGAALRYFADAVALGVPSADVARDRGLAHDLRGNWRAAQRDYKLALGARPDPEAVRRLAVSQAAGGDEDDALKTLEPQLRAKNAAAWRVRAFILAMSGDAAGAQKAAAAVLPAAAASGFAPYFRQMAGLTAGQKVAAAQFGSMPGEARTIRMADLMSEGERAARVALESVRAPERVAARPLDAGRPDAGQAALGRSGDGVPLPMTTTGGRVAGTLVPTRVVAVTPRNLPREAPAVRTAAPEIATANTASAQPIGGTGASPEARIATVAEQPSAVITTVPTPSTASAPPALPVTTPTFPKPALTAPAVVGAALPDPAPATEPVQGPPVPSDVLPTATTAALEPAPVTVVPITSAPPPSQPKVEARVAVFAPPPPRPKVERAVERAAARTEVANEQPAPRRHYVQVGVGQDVRALGADWRRLRARHAALLDGQDAWTAPLNRTNRLLVGPFPTGAAAQAFVNKLAAGEVSAIRYASEPGQEISPLR